MFYNSLKLALIGSNLYTCICNEGWTDNRTNLQPDCDSPVNKCDKIICINGFCDEKTIKCECDHGWTGSSCQWPYTGIWYPWGPWSVCYPSCGENRKRNRSTRCIDETKNCGLNYEQQSCSKQSCDFGSSDYFGWTAWSRCDQECDYGYEHQNRTCTALDVELNRCMDRKELKNFKSRKCFLKKCKYNRKYALSEKNISILLLVAFFLGLIGVLVKIILHVYFKEKSFFYSLKELLSLTRETLSDHSSGRKVALGESVQNLLLSIKKLARFWVDLMTRKCLDLAKLGTLKF